jgi:hypothetical protein
VISGFFGDENTTNAPFGGMQIGVSVDKVSLCVSTTSAAMLGDCTGPGRPPADSFHHWLVRYDGIGTGTGQGGSIELFIDGAPVLTKQNDGANNPVFTTAGLPNTLIVGAPQIVIDDLQIFDQVFTPAVQCTQIIGGAFSAGTCTLP